MAKKNAKSATVTDIAKHRTSKTTKKKVVDERVWNKAVEIANGDLKRVQAISETEVIVWNNSNWKKALA